MKKLVLAVAILVGAITFAQEEKAVNAQSNVIDSKGLKAEKAKKLAEIAKLQGEVNAITNQLFTMPGWKFGGSGILGANFAGFNEWYTSPLGKDAKTANIGVKVTGFANFDDKAYFWRNSGSLDLGWQQIDPTGEGEGDAAKYKGILDVLQLNTLFGYKLMDDLAASVMGTYRTTVIENFNNPGFLDFGIGATWTPISELVVVAHPLNYNYVFKKEGSTYESSLGCKFLAEYNKSFGFLTYYSKLDAFLSYTDRENLSNWNWDNTLGFSVLNGIGVSLTGSLRQNKQEAYNATGAETMWGSLENSSNKLQSKWMLGLSYGF